jgi:hypothetical protein
MVNISHAEESSAASKPASNRKDIAASNAANGCTNTAVLYNKESAATTDSPRGTITSMPNTATL